MSINNLFYDDSAHFLDKFNDRKNRELVHRDSDGKSEMERWAEQEVEIALVDETEDDFGYAAACMNSALKTFKTLLKDGHSGFSIGMTKHILNRLIDGRPLSAIYDTPDSWNLCSRFGDPEDPDNYNTYQCKRMSSLFKYEYSDGRVEYKDINAYYCVNINNPNGVSYHSSLIQKLMDQVYPISMPYFPGKPTKVVCDDFLTDPKNGDFDTVGIFYAIKPDDSKVEINRFYKEAEVGWDEITREVYDKRKENKINYV